MLPYPDLRYVMETAFLPTLCTCTISPEGMMSIELTNPRTLAEELTMSGVPVADLSTGRAIAALVIGIREKIRLRHVAQAAHLQQHGSLR